MTAHDVNGKPFEISPQELQRLISAAGGGHSPGEPPGGKAAAYAERTEKLLTDAQEELLEAAGEFPEKEKDLFEFAFNHGLFGSRADTHIMINFFKVFYSLLQKETHDVQDE